MVNSAGSTQKNMTIFSIKFLDPFTYICKAGGFRYIAEHRFAYHVIELTQNQYQQKRHKIRDFSAGTIISQRRLQKM
jgi:hypothetical protein